jgi:hypothetical protein
MFVIVYARAGLEHQPAARITPQAESLSQVRTASDASGRLM